MLKQIRLTSLLLIAIILTACSFSLAEDVTPPPGYQPPSAVPQNESLASGAYYPLVSPDPLAGEGIYLEKCAPCHGESGLGDGEKSQELPNPVTPIGSLDVARSATPAQWYAIVTEGNLERFMPPFPSLSDRQRWDVVAYALSLSISPHEGSDSEEIYLAECAGCHGIQGQGGESAAGMPVPDFRNQEYISSRSAADFYQAITSGAGSNMPSYADQLSDSQRWELASYLRQFSYASPGEPVAGLEVTPQPESQSADSPGSSAEVITPTLQTGDISGLVSNLSSGELPVGEEIMLHGFDGMQLVISQTVPLEADGSYTFPGVEMPAGRIFFTTLQHQDVTYGSEFGTVENQGAALELPITVYDSTTDPSALKIDRLHLFLEQLDEESMRVAELYVISNTGDKTIVPAGAGQASVLFKLPEGAKDLQFQDGELGGRYIPTADGFGDSAAIYPGQGNYQVLVAYNLPFKRKLNLSHTMTMPAEAIVILMPQESLRLKGDNLIMAGTRDVDGIPYQMYNRGSIDSGEQLEFTVNRQGFSLGSNSTLGMVIGLAVLGLVLIFGGVFLYWRNRTDAALEGESQAVVSIESQESPEALMDAILALDDLYQAGEIPVDAYRQRRAELKSQLQSRIHQEDQDAG